MNAEPTRPLWGCAHNPERSNFQLGDEPCAGRLHYESKVVQGLRVHFWVCTRHRDEEN